MILFKEKIEIIFFETVWKKVTKMVKCEADNGFENFGCWMGNFSAFIYFLVQIPQIYKNFKRKSTEGFSEYFVLIRFIGLSFFVVNGIIEDISTSLLVAGFLILISFAVLIFQYAFYNFHVQFYFTLLFPVFPALLSSFVKSSIPITDFINPLSQILCYIPFIYKCTQKHTTKGVSLLGQHINFLASALGMTMCTITCQCTSVGWLFHVISMCQSLIIYLLALEYDEFKLIDIKEEFEPEKRMPDLELILQT